MLYLFGDGGGCVSVNEGDVDEFGPMFSIDLRMESHMQCSCTHTCSELLSFSHKNELNIINTLNHHEQHFAACVRIKKSMKEYIMHTDIYLLRPPDSG